MPIPQSKAVYSKGATTEGGAFRNASVSRCWAIEENRPIAASRTQSPVRMGIHCGAAMHPAITVMRLIIQNTTLTVVSVRVTLRSAMELNSYPAADRNAATAPSETKLDAEGLSIVRTPIRPTLIAA